ncbi:MULTISPECIES: tetratricopeptide repeat protein [unclassified Methanoregula]|uniref:tetratricopeptide repeat protein n=1 Tax=unclassified Methanoregula TaxID=2649730 RepID=UPI0009D317A8|nr:MULTISPECIES: tetratricopeptide repeat protein [unclassified Methanoregula]OPX62487.1 MAG: Tetratricopeptide repeat protein [Methanoregula sp. PtaB.Bin085]
MEWLYSKGIPIEAQYLYRKARELARQGQPGMALNYFRQAIVIAPQYSQAYYQMGNCLALLGKYPEALEKYERAIRIDPSAPKFRETMEHIRSRQGNNKKE